jgi:sulfoxide reductase heme-binding subunit YedZ
LFIASLVPLAWVAFALLSDLLRGTRLLGSNPITTAEDFTGEWALRFLAITLALTPARRILGWNWLIKHRRMLGLFTFFYTVVHVGIYLGVDMVFDWRDVLHDIAKHPYIMVGLAGFILLVPLAVTSSAAMIRRLGGARWRALHRLVYVIAVLGVVHYWWSVKQDVEEPLMFAAIFAGLLGWRVVQPRIISRRSTVASRQERPPGRGSLTPHGATDD